MKNISTFESFVNEAIKEKDLNLRKISTGYYEGTYKGHKIEIFKDTHLGGWTWHRESKSGTGMTEADDIFKTKEKAIEGLIHYFENLHK
jgi:hypothetical protein